MNFHILIGHYGACDRQVGLCAAEAALVNVIEVCNSPRRSGGAEISRAGVLVGLLSCSALGTFAADTYSPLIEAGKGRG